MAQRYWEQAHLDIDVARSLLVPDRYYAAAGFAHRAAEKSLKAARWHLRAEEPPWIHELGTLSERLAESVREIPDGVKRATSQLDPLFVETRYPSGKEDEPIPSRLVTEDRARAAVASAEEVMAWVATLLLLPPGRPRRSSKN